MPTSVTSRGTVPPLHAETVSRFPADQSGDQHQSRNLARVHGRLPPAQGLRIFNVGGAGGLAPVHRHHRFWLRELASPNMWHLFPVCAVRARRAKPVLASAGPTVFQLGLQCAGGAGSRRSLCIVLWVTQPSVRPASRQSRSRQHVSSPLGCKCTLCVFHPGRLQSTQSAAAGVGQ